MVANAIASGVFKRPDFRESTGPVDIFQSTAPDWFWANVRFYSLVSIAFWFVALIFVIPLAYLILSNLKQSK